MSLSADPRTWVGASIVGVAQFSREALDLVLGRADVMRTAPRRETAARQAHRVLATVFYEPSTRTSCSFQAAMLRLGGGVVAVSEATSSAKKGESLEDTMRSLACYADALVLRHPTAGAAAAAAAAIGATTPLINGGDGVGEHPTQALLDVYTLCRELGGPASSTAALEGRTIVLAGDLKHGRTVHSLARVLAAFDVALVYAAPPGLEMPSDVRDFVAAANKATQRDAPLADAVADADALYVTRVQRERFVDAAAYEACRGAYVVDAALLSTAKPSCAVLHPLPRVDEVSTDVDADPRAAYFRQMQNGLYVRMALLDLLLGEQD